MNHAPVVRLVKPDSEEISDLTTVRIDGIDIWYEAERLLPLKPGQPIHIGYKKFLFVGWLFVEGVRKEID